MKISEHIPHLNCQLWLSIKDLEILDRLAVNPSAMSLDLKDKYNFFKLESGRKTPGAGGVGEDAAAGETTENSQISINKTILYIKQYLMLIIDPPCWQVVLQDLGGAEDAEFIDIRL